VVENSSKPRTHHPKSQFIQKWLDWWFALRYNGSLRPTERNDRIPLMSCGTQMINICKPLIYLFLGFEMQRDVNGLRLATVKHRSSTINLKIFQRYRSSTGK
jgi:hypothetical protein